MMKKILKIFSSIISVFAFVFVTYLTSAAQANAYTAQGPYYSSPMYFWNYSYDKEVTSIRENSTGYITSTNWFGVVADHSECPNISDNEMHDELWVVDNRHGGPWGRIKGNYRLFNSCSTGSIVYLSHGPSGLYRYNAYRTKGYIYMDVINYDHYVAGGDVWSPRLYWH